jgi:hypothetical protein
MHRTKSVVAVASLAILSASPRIPATVAAAEAEGASFPHGATPRIVDEVFSHAFSGTAARTCVAPPRDSIAGGSLRSGEFIVRGRFSGYWGPKANRDGKYLWAPLHNPYVYPAPGGLLIRAARLGHPSDTVRVAEAHAAYSARRDRFKEAAYPSLVRFPAAGEWLVIATSGKDWGCFLITVEQGS